MPDRWRAHSSIWLTALVVGCARMISIDYEPSSPWKGQGTVAVLSFRYDPAENDRVRRREVGNESSRQDWSISLAGHRGIFYGSAPARIDLLRVYGRRNRPDHGVRLRRQVLRRSGQCGTGVRTACRLRSPQGSAERFRLEMFIHPTRSQYAGGRQCAHSEGNSGLHAAVY